jgi:TPR repeat protein
VLKFLCDDDINRLIRAKSAEQGYAKAQYDLGYMYQNGEGVTQDYKQAIKWYTKSAEQGDADAQSNLGYMYENGYGVIQDYILGYAWYSVAGANESELGAENRDIILKLMTPSQIEKGQEMANELFEKYGK